MKIIYHHQATGNTLKMSPTQKLHPAYLHYSKQQDQFLQSGGWGQKKVKEKKGEKFWLTLSFIKRYKTKSRSKNHDLQNGKEKQNQ